MLAAEHTGERCRGLTHLLGRRIELPGASQQPSALQPGEGGFGVVLAEASPLRGECALQECLGMRHAAAFGFDPRQVSQRRGGLGMVLAECLAERLDHGGILGGVGIALGPPPGGADAVQTDL